MNLFRPIFTGIWDEDNFIKMPDSAKLLFFFLRTNPKTTQIGIYDLSERAINYYGIDYNSIKPDLEHLQSNGYIFYKYTDDRIEITVKHALLQYVGKGGAALKSLLEKEAKAVSKERMNQLMDFLLPDHEGDLHITILKFFEQYCGYNIVDTIVKEKVNSNSKKVIKKEKVNSNSTPNGTTETVLKSADLITDELTDTELTETDFEEYLFHKVEDLAKERCIPTSPQSIRDFIAFNLDRNKKKFFVGIKWQDSFVQWSAHELNETALVGSEHYKNLYK